MSSQLPPDESVGQPEAGSAEQPDAGSAEQPAPAAEPADQSATGPVGQQAAVPPAPPPPPPAPPPPPPPPPAPPVPQAPRRGGWWRWGCGCSLAGCLIVVVLVLVVALVGTIGTIGGFEGLAVGGEKVALIRVDGVLVAGQSGFSPFEGTATGSDDVVAQIERAVNDADVKAILLRVNSPGGSAAGSQEVYNAVGMAKKRKPVVVSMADAAASGGYYISAGANEIWADPATLTGSIGAIATHTDISGLYGKLGLKAEVMKAGKLKDMMSPYRPMGAEERAVVERLLKEIHEQFIEAVAEGRGMTVEEVRQLADGRIYSGAQAKENKLVDELGGLQDALRAAGQLGGVAGRAQMKEYGPSGLLRWLFGSSGSRGSTRIGVTGGLLYDPFAARLVRGALQRDVMREHDVVPGEM